MEEAQVRSVRGEVRVREHLREPFRLIALFPRMAQTIEVVEAFGSGSHRLRLGTHSRPKQHRLCVEVSDSRNTFTDTQREEERRKEGERQNKRK